ncbi:polysaccharide deacetylase family protein [Legionella maioricensis]|uniref:Polysaccharide deacetylase family protein n=1 Tax=Legionella maioricensis TaxID=2896528 RepID=A0A9X2D1Z7_9GAMM|nr:polysaccharide deacetylase family protein [Legionella maioricensis]MCL9684854.1 polysaccharide deacetylase family protein [Legionella maioricensis]MCL9688534.1 polysaccharide deacetylase family protein [Legionella maioricensis]
MTRDLIGYGPDSIINEWPNKAKIAINFVINYEEGGELSPINGDPQAEVYGSSFPFSAKPPGIRNYSIESFYEYGSRVGIWRLLRLFDQKNISLTFFITGYALILNPLFSSYLASSNHEVAGHGWRWIDYSKESRATEKKHIYRCIETLEQLTGQRPLGWYTGRRSEHTRDLLMEIGGFIYDSDSYADDLPYKINNHLIIPYSLDTNDFRFTTSPGFSIANNFYDQLKNTFDYLYQENRPAIMTVGLHPRLSGKPGLCSAVKLFLDYILQFQDIWIAKRIEIAQYWLAKS